MVIFGGLVLTVVVIMVLYYGPCLRFVCSSDRKRAMGMVKKENNDCHNNLSSVRV